MGLLTLTDSIQNLYTTFARYGLHAPIKGCDCCVSPEDIARIQSKPLKQLDADDLEKYSLKALTTWGEVKDLKHFLPRLFELASRQLLNSEDAGNSFESPILFSKLAYAQWHQWPEPEQKALRDFLHALWQESLNSERDISDILTSIASTKTPLEPFLNHWLSASSNHATKNLVNFAETNLGSLSHNKLRDHYWSDLPQQSETLIQWLLAEPTLQHLEKFALENTESPEAENALDLASYLRALRP